MGQIKKKYEEIDIANTNINDLIKDVQVKKIINWHVSKYRYAFDSYDDAKQEAYLCLIRAFNTFKPEKKCPFLPYFFRIVRNTFITANKKNSKILSKYEDKKDFDKRIISDYIPYNFNSLHEFNNLSMKEKNILFDKFFNSKSLKEISADIGVSKEWTRVLIKNILLKIKTEV